jgi:hypothetical protein
MADIPVIDIAKFRSGHPKGAGAWWNWGVPRATPGSFW